MSTVLDIFGLRYLRIVFLTLAAADADAIIAATEAIPTARRRIFIRKFPAVEIDIFGAVSAEREKKDRHTLYS